MASMFEAPQNDPLLKRFRAAVGEVYGDRVERVVLFGSRARGDAQPDSDYDIAVFPRDMTDTDRAAEMNRLADLSTAILYDGGPFIHAMPYRSSSYNAERMPLMHEIRADGIDL
jgi:predicted nucleotidyltransferase